MTTERKWAGALVKQPCNRTFFPFLDIGRRYVRERCQSWHFETKLKKKKLPS